MLFNNIQKENSDSRSYKQSHRKISAAVESV